MLREFNRIFQNWMRKKRLLIGKYIWDRKKSYQQLKENNIIKNNNIKSILFLRYDGKIGDAVINTPMFREIKKKYPNIKIGIVTRESNYQIIENNPYIEKKYIFHKNILKIIKLAAQIKKEKYDLLVDFSEMLRVNQMMFINLCHCKYNLGYNRKNWNLFDWSFSEPEGNYHITELYKIVLEKLGISEPNLMYDLYFNEKDKTKVEDKLRLYDGKKIYVLNPYAASKHREINEKNIRGIIDIILKKKDGIVFIIGEKSKKDKIENIIKDYNNLVVYPELDTIMETAYLIKKADYIITPDTSIVHIAACFAKPMIGIYRLDHNEENRKNSNLWAPNYNEAKQVFAIDRTVKDGEEPDINKFNLSDIEKILNS